MKDKNHMTISIDTDKDFDKIKHVFDKKKKTLQKISIERTYPNIIKAVYNKLRAIIILISKNWKHFL